MEHAATKGSRGALDSREPMHHQPVHRERPSKAGLQTKTFLSLGRQCATDPAGVAHRSRPLQGVERAALPP
jgi:hypothetical protein